MSSNLKVNTILPSVGSNIGIGTNGGELNVDGGCKVQVGTALTLGHSIGLQYATQNLHSDGFEINQINASGVVTATSFVGSGANLTSLPAQATIANNADNRVITGGSGVNLNGEANLTFDGTTLTTNGSGGINISASGSDLTMNSAGAIFTGNGGNATDPIVANGSDTNTGYFYPAADTLAFTTGGSERLRIDSNGKLILGTEYVNAANANSAISLFLSGTRSGQYGGAHTNAIIFDNQTAAVDAGGSITLAGYSGSQAIAKALIRGGNEGSASTQDGYFSVFTRPSSGSLSEKFRIKSDGQLDLNRGRVNDAGHMVYRGGGRIAGTATVSFDIPVLSDGNIYWIEAFYTHHSLAYGGYLYGVYGAYSGHNGLQINNTIGSSTAGGSNVGTWSVSRGNAGTPVVVAKSAGSYGGMGYYWIHVHAGSVPNL